MKRNIGKFWAAVIFTAVVFGTMPANAKKAKSSDKEETKTAKTSKSSKPKKAKYDDAAYKAAILDGNYDLAMGMLLGLKEMTIAQKMDVAMFQHYYGDYETAATTMEEASKTMGDFFAANLNKKGSQKSSGGAILSELATPYMGNIYEFLLVDTFNSLNYYKQGKLDDAVSCINRVLEKQDSYGNQFNTLLEDEEIKEEPQIDENGNAVEVKKPDTSKFLPVKPTEKNIYKASALTDYLQIVIGTQRGSDTDESNKDYTTRELKILAPNVDTTWSKSLKQNGRIEVLALTGRIAQKVEHIEYVPSPFTAIFGEAGNYKYVWPVYEGNKTKVPTVKNIKLSTGETTNAILLEDFDNAVENNIALNARKAANRSVARSTITKTVTATGFIASIEAAKQKAAAAAAIAEKAAITAGIAALNGIDEKEVADLRQCMALPSKAYCAGFTVEPGTYSVIVEYDNGTSETIENVVVKTGKPVLVESICK